MTVHPLHSSSALPKQFTYPFSSLPHPLARTAAEEVMEMVRAYMASHTESELHRQGKMFGVLVVEPLGYLAAFSAMLDGQMEHEGFVPPVYDWSTPAGYFRAEEAAISFLTEQLPSNSQADTLRQERKQRSQALQRWLFAQFRMLNANGESKDLLDIFASEPTILSREDYFSGSKSDTKTSGTLPPSGAGECCAPKLLQYAYLHGLRPVCMAEFWMGAPARDEVRTEGHYYPACQGKCKPILRHMLQGIDVAPNPQAINGRELANKIKTVYEDDALVVIDKPSGLLSVPGKEDAYSAFEYLKERYGQPVFAVHRLDMDTSGLLIFAKSATVAEALRAQFLRREVKKMYLAVVEPLKQVSSFPKKGTVSLPLLPNPLDRPRQMVDYQHGKSAVTEWELLGERVNSRGEKGLLLALYPQTGRTHQLRVHCAHPDGLGCPIIGDRIYGNAGDRLMLHAAELQLVHPVTHEMLHLRSEPKWD